MLQNCSGLPMDTMGLLNNIMVSADCEECGGFMNSVSYDRMRKTRVITHSEYMKLADTEHSTYYRKQI